MSKMDKTNESTGKARRIGILPIKDFAVLSYAALAEPLRAANFLAGHTLYDIVNIGIGSDAVQSSGAATIQTQAKVGDDVKLDALFVVAGGDLTEFEDRATMTWLARLARAGVQLGGVSGGPVILARAGLMEGRRMTLHWEYAEALSEISPHLLVERTLYVIDRDRVTCAGGTAPMDLTHALISRHHGSDFARRVSDWFMHTDVRPAVGPQRSGLVERVGCNVPAILDAVEAMENHLSDKLSLSQLAAFSAQSPRQLTRLFREKLNLSPMEYYRQLRLDKAQNLLRNSALSLTEIALATGFANSSHFSRSYTAHYGAPPSTYR